MSLFALLLAQLLAEAPPAEVRATTVELEVLPLVYGEFQVALHHAGSRFTAFGVRAGYRAGGPGTNLWSMHPASGGAVILGGEARIFPLGHAPTQLFVELAVGSSIAYEGVSSVEPAGSWNQAGNALSLAIGWCFQFFDRWVVTVRAGVQAQTAATFSPLGLSTGFMTPIIPLIGVSTGGGL